MKTYELLFIFCFCCCTTGGNKAKIKTNINRQDTNVYSLDIPEKDIGIKTKNTKV